jgi:hypothetical protein
VCGARGPPHLEVTLKRPMEDVISLTLPFAFAFATQRARALFSFYVLAVRGFPYRPEKKPAGWFRFRSQSVVRSP